MKNERDYIKKLLDSGYSVSFKDLSICNIGQYIEMRKTLEKKYQVDSRNFSELYDNVEDALTEFLKRKRIKYKRR